jgi:CubicO group peptidase (beta-lactamase class C family)
MVGLVAACAAVAALPATADAKTCRSGQVDRGGTCTSSRTVAANVIGITRAVMRAEDAKAAIVRIDVGNRTLVNRAFGFSMAGVPATTNMKFRPGSMAIPLLTSIALQLQDKHKLDLDDTIARWYPNFPNADKVTLRMLASVTSGYPDYIQENPPFQAAQLAEPFRQWTDDDLIRYSFAQPIVCVPGTCFHYAHTNFLILGRILEAVTGQSVTTMMKKRFLGPLGLRDTRISKFPAIPAPTLHAYTTARGVYEDSTTWSPSWGIGTGLVMTSTASDQLKVIRAIGRGKLFSRSAMLQFARPLSRGLPGSAPVDYGLGIVMKNGWMFQNPVFNGYAGIAAYLPAAKLSLVIENTQGPNAVDGKSIATSIFEQLARYLTPAHQL